jgi:hypothetical protein
LITAVLNELSTHGSLTVTSKDWLISGVHEAYAFVTPLLEVTETHAFNFSVYVPTFCRSVGLSVNDGELGFVWSIEIVMPESEAATTPCGRFVVAGS